jgi:peptide/nickel transport system ATP-binding protein
MFSGVDLASLTKEELRAQRSAMQIVFQDPFAAMNPRMLILDIIAEGIRTLQADIDTPECITIVSALLKQVGLDETALYRYPHVLDRQFHVRQFYPGTLLRSHPQFQRRRQDHG